jgi:hypothetical protein
MPPTEWKADETINQFSTENSTGIQAQVHNSAFICRLMNRHLKLKGFLRAFSELDCKPK